ncbi:MAG: FHA domain-containing protein [Deltaproteobacteria bacterium]|nr:FHA domain-containing protein [Deltaproteobacteria bacterium]
MATKRTTPKRRKSPARPVKPARPAAPDDATQVVVRAAAAAPAPAAAVLRVTACPDERLVGRAFAVGTDDVTLGRDAGCSVPLPDSDVSRQHARIVRTGNSHVLVDMESTNGTRLNGKPVSEATLRDGDRVSLGQSQLVYEA